MSERKTEMCVSIKEKPISEICITCDVTEALDKYPHVSGIVRDVIDKIDRHLDYLNKHLKDIGLSKHPKIEEYEERESLHQHSKRIANRILRNVPMAHYNYNETTFENVKYEDLDDEELVAEVLRNYDEETERVIERFAQDLDVNENPVDFVCTKAGAEFNLSGEESSDEGFCIILHET